MKGRQDMGFAIPQSLKTEHEELHAELRKATKEAGKIGQAAQSVAAILHPHFLKEEEYALPPLGLLYPLAEGRVSTERQAVPGMTNRLKNDLGQMLEEHKAIVARLEGLTDAAKEKRKYSYVSFAENLVLHAQAEEEVLYPAAILVGEYLTLTGRG
jgi:Hemerythrin HHE cation binding domain